MTTARMTLRAMPFVFEPTNEDGKPGHWNAARPEFSQVVNSASLAMPFLEPYLIRSMRAARGQITDSVLQAEVDLYIRQEAAHYKQHQLFNNTLRAAGYTCIDAIERTLAADYSKLEKGRSLRFNLAYAEGFEAMALVIGQMLIEDRVHLFGDSKPAVASLVLWHFVEEIEHKSVAYDVLHHLHPGYLLRITGLIYATAHIFWRTRQGYHRLLKEDGLSGSLASHWALSKVIYRVLFNILPKWLRILRPGYHPRQIADPAWGLAWAALFRDNPAGAAKLDTAQLSGPAPLPLTA